MFFILSFFESRFNTLIIPLTNVEKAAIMYYNKGKARLDHLGGCLWKSEILNTSRQLLIKAALPRPLRHSTSPSLH